MIAKLKAWLVSWAGMVPLVLVCLAFVLGFVVGRGNRPSPEEEVRDKERAVRIAITALEAYAQTLTNR